MTSSNSKLQVSASTPTPKLLGSTLATSATCKTLCESSHIFTDYKGELIMIINNFRPFKGQHCETTATGSLLNQLGIELSEPMLFGLGEGLGFFFWKMKSMDSPLLLGRIKPTTLTENITKNLNLDLEILETSSVKVAWENVKKNIDSEIPVGLKLDMYYLDYFKIQEHFAGHYVAIYGYDDKYAYLIDCEGFGSKVKTSLKSLELARNTKEPMSSRNLSYTINKTNNKYNLKKAIINAIKNNAKEFLNPPIQNLGYMGIIKTSKEVIKCFNNKDTKWDFKNIAMFMEEAGTGGAIFRNFYRDFLKESYELIQIEQLNEAYQMFTEIAELWTRVSRIFNNVGEKKDIRNLNQASDILMELSEKEKSAMEILNGLK